MTSVQTKRREMFWFDLAAKTGTAVDHKGRKHSVVAATKNFLITEYEGEEFCFDKSGSQMSRFQSTRLVEPAVTEESLLTYIVYNAKNHEILYMSDLCMDAGKVLDRINEDSVHMINVTHPANKDTLENLGIHQTRWLVMNEEVAH